jgi:hypothetical protein
MPSPPGFEIARYARTAAQGVLYGTSLLIAVCALIVGIGIIDGFSEGVEEQAPCTTIVQGGSCINP